MLITLCGCAICDCVRCAMCGCLMHAVCGSVAVCGSARSCVRMFGSARGSVWLSGSVAVCGSPGVSIFLN
jgi:hypothetical protein